MEHTYHITISIDPWIVQKCFNRLEGRLLRIFLNWVIAMRRTLFWIGYLNLAEARVPFQTSSISGNETLETQLALGNTTQIRTQNYIW